MQHAVQRLIGFDPTTEPIGDRLSNFRIATIALVDELPDWNGLDAWLEAERVLGAALGRQVLEAARDDDGIDERLSNLEPFATWAQVLSQNLRQFRRVGFDAVTAAQLRAAAQESIDDLYVAHGWERPATTDRVKPLDS